MQKIALVLEIVLIVFLPLLTLGYDFFEYTSLYDRLIGVLGVETSLDNVFTTTYGERTQVDLSYDSNSREFKDLWNLIQANTFVALPEGIPTVIKRGTIINASFVHVPENNSRREVVLIPDSVPIFALYCRDAAQSISDCNGVVVGTVRDIQAWVSDRREKSKTIINGTVTGISILLGFIVHWWKNREPNGQMDRKPHRHV